MHCNILRLRFEDILLTIFKHKAHLRNWFLNAIKILMYTHIRVIIWGKSFHWDPFLIYQKLCEIPLNKAENNKIKNFIARENSHRDTYAFITYLLFVYNLKTTYICEFESHSCEVYKIQLI